MDREATQNALNKAKAEADRYRTLRDNEKQSLMKWHDHNRSMHDALADVRRLSAVLATLPE